MTQCSLHFDKPQKNEIHSMHVTQMKPGDFGYKCSAQSENLYNSGIVLRKVRILTLSGKIGILTLRSAIPELLVRKVGIGTK